jgi:hypothetical protein
MKETVNTFMAIKNRDGTTYTLGKPNPIMLKQDLWEDGSKFILHNFKADEVTLHNFEELPEKPKVPEPVPEKKQQRIEDIVPEEIKVPVKETPIPESDKFRRKHIAQNIILVYCMPAISKDIIDPLYNDNKVSIEFGPQFTFESIIVDTNDLMQQLWTNTSSVTKGSILYLPHTRRWWRVERINKVDNKDEYILNCMPSSLQPSFKL